MPYLIAPLLLLTGQSIGAATVPATTQGPSAAIVAQLPDCARNTLSFATDAEDGNFNGMQKGGTLLVVRNLGPAACRLAGLPTLTLKDRHSRMLPIHRARPIGMHPGPVVLPVGIAVGAEATSPITWIQGPVFTKSTCYDVAYASISVGGATAQIPFQAHICGEKGSATFNQPPLQTDPTL